MKKVKISALEVASAYAMWGMLTIFWNLLSKVDSMFILSQRICWSMVFMFLFLAVSKKSTEIKQVFSDKKSFFTIFLCGILITVNWGVYIYAVNSGHVLDASLGYFIEPVIVALIGLLVFKEKVSKLEKITLAFSFIGLVYMIATTGTVPILSVVIAGSFAIYGAIKKNIKLSPYVSLFAETLVITPFALLFMVYKELNGTGSVGVLSGAEFLLLPAAGVITALPLLLFNMGVKKLPYYISGILMYINPVLQFIMGVFYFKEELKINKLIAFAIIGVGVLFTVADKIIIYKKEKEKVKAEAQVL